MGQTSFIMGNPRSCPVLAASIHSLLRGCASAFPPAGQILFTKQNENRAWCQVYIMGDVQIASERSSF